MKHKTSELTGALLAHAVALAAGYKVKRDCAEWAVWLPPEATPDGCPVHSFGAHGYRPDMRWEHGGPIIEREHLRVEWHSDGGGFWRSVRPAVVLGDWPISRNGATALEAAMRAYVASKFGEEVELP